MRKWLLIVFAAIPVIFLPACSNHNDKTVKPCTPAMQCVFVQSTTAERCAVSPDQDRRILLRMSNNRADLRVVVAFEEYVRHLNRPQPVKDDTIFRMLSVPADGRVDLGCQYVEVDSGIFDSYSFRIRSACFENDPDCKTSELAPSPEAAFCSQKCDPNDPWCIRRRIPTNSSDPNEQQVASAAAIQARTLLASTPPFDARLTNLFGIGAACTLRDPLRVAANGDFIETGGGCNIYFPIQGSGRSLYLKVGSRVEGILSGNATEKTMSFRAGDMQLAWFDAADNLIGEESVAKAVVTRNQVRIAGTRASCVWLDLPGD